MKRKLDKTYERTLITAFKKRRGEESSKHRDRSDMLKPKRQVSDMNCAHKPLLVGNDDWADICTGLLNIV